MRILACGFAGSANLGSVIVPIRVVEIVYTVKTIRNDKKTALTCDNAYQGGATNWWRRGESNSGP